MFNSFKAFFTEGHNRSLKAKKHIVASLVLKGISMAISFVVVPLYLAYLSEEKFGIWLTLSSVIGWFAFFDIGLGNGLRNKFAEARAKGDTALAKSYVSTTYAILTIISVVLFIVFFVVHRFLDWGAILNTPPGMVEEVGTLVFIVFAFFCVQFVVQLIKMVLIADQRPALSSAINTLGSLLGLVVVFVLYKTTESSLLYLGIAIGAINFVVPLVVSFFLFSGRYKAYAPSLKHVNFKQSRELLSLGFQFFVLQGAALIVFMTDNMIITQLDGPQEVPAYNIAYRYFGITTMVFTIITTPFWSAYTEAYHKNDMVWIRNTTRKVLKLWVLVVIGIGVMLALADWVYLLWVGEEIEVTFLLSLFMAVWVTLSTSTMIFANFLSGVGKIRISLYHAVFVSVVNIPLSIYFAKYLELGSAGVILASCVCVFPRAIIQPIQFKKIVSGTAKGIWNK